MQTRMTPRGRWLRGVSVAGLVLMTVGVGTIPASSEPADEPAGAVDEEAAFHELASRRNWQSYSDARPISPFFGIPGELKPTVPFARSWLDASPGRSECFAALYYPDEVIEEGVLQTTGQYKNNTMARTNNPPALDEETSEEIAPFGRPGPHAATNNPSRTECASVAVSGVGSEDGTVLVDGGYAHTHSIFDGDAMLTDTAVSRVQGVAAGPLRLHNLETYLKLEMPLEGDPLITYSMTIAGIEADGQPVVNLGGNGLVLAGQQVVARDLIDQFNAEVAKAGATLQKEAVSDYLRLVAPIVEEESDGGVTVTGPALEIRHNNTAQEGKGGNTMGVRLGYATVYAILNALEEFQLDPPSLDDAVPPAGPGGSGLGTEPAFTAPDPSSLMTANSPAFEPPTDGFGFDDTASSFGGGSSGFGADDLGAGDLTGAGTEAALPSTDTGLGVTAAPAGRSEALQLAAADTARAAKNTANGLLGGILVMVGALVWVGGMTVASRLKA
ncbi:MAG: hypothetical protein ACRDZ7_14025 [Acidimicrobiia bacterium]